MATLFVVSTQPLSGKTALCASLGSRFQSQGLRVGYVKPVASRLGSGNGRSPDEDVKFMIDTLDLSQTWDVISPVVLTDHQLESIMAGKTEPLADRVKAALSIAGKGRDVVLLEGAGNPWVGSMLGLSGKTVAEMGGARMLLVARYDGPATADHILGMAQELGSSLLGVVVNMVPDNALGFVNKTMAPFLVSRGVAVLGVLPEERSLMGLSVGDLARYVGGEFLRGEDRSEDLVEGFLMGALSTDYMQDYYSRRQNLAVITSGEKTDIQLFSMTSNTRCIILTGYRRPVELVMAQAAEHGIPLIMVKEDTLTIAEKVEGLFASIRFHQRQKLPIMARVLEAGFDFSALNQALGLAAKAT